MQVRDACLFMMFLIAIDGAPVTSSECDDENTDIGTVTTRVKIRKKPNPDWQKTTKMQLVLGLVTEPGMKSCCYDFGSSLCKIIDDRVLCGYERNPEIPQSKNSIFALPGNCRLRGGRVECGYKDTPRKVFRKRLTKTPTTEDQDQDRDYIVENDEYGALRNNRITQQLPATRCVQYEKQVVCGLLIH